MPRATKTVQAAPIENFTELPKMLDAETAARLLNVSGVMIRRLCASGKIKAVKCGVVWRINRDAFLEQYQIL